MTEQALPQQPRFPWWTLPAILFVLLMAALAAVVVLARDAGKSEAPPAVGDFQRPPGPSYRAFDVERTDGGKVTLTSGPAQDRKTVELDLSSARVWLLERVEAAALKPPLVVNVVSVANEVRNYTVRLMAFAPLSGAVNFEDDFIPLADGFAGHEPSQDGNERVVVSAVLESFDGRNGVTRTSTGPGTLFIDPGAPVRLLRAGTATDIQPGDRLAIHLDPNGEPDLARGVLVLTDATPAE